MNAKECKHATYIENLYIYGHGFVHRNPSYITWIKAVHKIEQADFSREPKTMNLSSKHSSVPLVEVDRHKCPGLNLTVLHEKVTRYHCLKYFQIIPLKLYDYTIRGSHISHMPTVWYSYTYSMIFATIFKFPMENLYHRPATMRAVIWAHTGFFSRFVEFVMSITPW